MDPHTGAIYAMASAPGFNPNDPSKITPADLQNPDVAWTFEPGSVNKLITVSAAIDRHIVTPTTSIPIPGSPDPGIAIPDYIIKDAEAHPAGEPDGRRRARPVEQPRHVADQPQASVDGGAGERAALVRARLADRCRPAGRVAGPAGAVEQVVGRPGRDHSLRAGHVGERAAGGRRLRDDRQRRRARHPEDHRGHDQRQGQGRPDRRRARRTAW